MSSNKRQSRGTRFTKEEIRQREATARYQELIDQQYINARDQLPHYVAVMIGHHFEKYSLAEVGWQGRDQFLKETVGKVKILVDREILKVVKDALRHAKSNKATDKK